MRAHVEVIKVNGELLYRHPVSGALVPAPEGTKQGQRMDVDITVGDDGDDVRETHYQDQLPITWEERPKL